LAAAVVAALAATLPSATAADSHETVTIVGGTFVMGRNDGLDDEAPEHNVTLATFAIDRNLVTNADFAVFLDAEGWKDRLGRRRYDLDDGDARITERDGKFVPIPGYADHPAVEVSWFGARDYCRWRGARLPTEAEWERAARGFDRRIYPWGNAAPDSTRAHFGQRYNATAPIGSYPAGATADRLLDMAGNVHQWTASLYRPYPYRSDDGRDDPEAVGERVTRGGAHDSPAGHLSAAWRGRGVSRGPAAGHHHVGFRCAADRR
jgi:iron(II)-dependent oxidoreductase